MIKYLVVIIGLLGLTSCGVKDEQYYRTHPQELQAAIKACPQQKPPVLTCTQIEELGNRVNRLAYQLQSSPQVFGNKILTLEQTIAQQKLQLKNEGKNSDIQASLEQNMSQLTEYLSIVKWLESPES